MSAPHRLGQRRKARAAVAPGAASCPRRSPRPPVTGRSRCAGVNLEGDDQADRVRPRRARPGRLRVCERGRGVGGATWSAASCGPAAFGENLTLRGRRCLRRADRRALAHRNDRAARRRAAHALLQARGAHGGTGLPAGVPALRAPRRLPRDRGGGRARGGRRRRDRPPPGARRHRRPRDRGAAARPQPAGRARARPTRHAAEARRLVRRAPSGVTTPRRP